MSTQIIIHIIFLFVSNLRQMLFSHVSFFVMFHTTCIISFCHFTYFVRNLAKLKEAKSKYEEALKAGSDAAELKKQLDSLVAKKAALEEHEEQMRKKEKV